MSEFIKQVRQASSLVIPGWFHPSQYLTRLARKRTGCQVRSGPFKGVRYTKESIGSAYIPKLLGIYERELVPQVEQICAAGPAVVVDIGAAEGYYAIGLAVRNPKAKVIAFETERSGQAALREMAWLNSVGERLVIRSRCEPADLALALDTAANPVVVCDVEGYEQKLLDPQAVPALRRAMVLAEMHEHICAGVTVKIKRAFQATHLIEEIHQTKRHRADFPWSTFGTRILHGSYIDWAVSEWRPVRMSWLWMVPRA